MEASGRFRSADLTGSFRESAVPILVESFVGIYRWHAKRTLRRVPTVRGAWEGEGLVGVSMLEELAPGVGYVYYVAVRPAARHRGVGGFLLDDALERFRALRFEIAYAAVEADNEGSRRLFSSRGFRIVEADEPNFREGGLGAWGLRSKMVLVSGEVLLGMRINPPGTSVELEGPPPGG